MKRKQKSIVARIGVAGWSIPKAHAKAFPAEGTHLQRYAAVFPAVEINSSFYRSHKPATYERWAASVPPAFKFAVKLPKEITHTRRLVKTNDVLKRFLGEAQGLGPKLGPVLVQLPPSFAYDAKVVGAFFEAMRKHFAGQIVCEPRHASWFLKPADSILKHLHVARVAADPARHAKAGTPGGWPNLVYRRLHGAPKMYYSTYTSSDLRAVAQSMRTEAERASEAWCIFDNTTLGHAAGNALKLMSVLRA